MIDTLIILGNHLQALGLSRMAAKEGLYVILYSDYKNSVTKYSNTCKEFYLFKDKEDLLDKLLQDHKDKNAMLIATNDNLVDFISENYDSLKLQFSLTLPEPEIVKIGYNKRLTYKLASKIGIPIPTSFYPDSLEEIEELANKLPYPVILKPAVMHTFHKATGKKVFSCANSKSLIENYNKITQIIPPDEVIIQEFLQGGAKTLYSYGSFSANGEVYGGFVANRIRQKPMDFGISTCYARSVQIPIIEQYAKKFLNELNYLGLSEVEFMYDEITDEYKLIEINTRAWKWHSIANKLEIPLFSMMLHYLNGKDVEKKFEYEENIGWVERLTDTYIVINELLKGRMSIKEYISTMKIKKESAAWSRKDPIPGLMYILLSPYLLIKRS